MIKIDKEFEALIPPLSADEFQQLEANILKDGIRDPLVVWPQENGDEILLDGHNRWKIAAKHGGISFKTVKMDFGVREAVKLWIIRNQLGKRNLPLVDKVTLEDKKRDILAKQAKKIIGGDKKSEEYKKSLQRNLGNDTESRREKTTDYKIAKAAGTSEDTVRKVRKINEKGTPEQIEQIRSGEKTINGVFNEIRNKEIKRLPSASEYADQVKDRHEEFQNQKVQTIEDAKRDMQDKSFLSHDVLEKLAKIPNGLMKTYAQMTGGEINVSYLNDSDRKEAVSKLQYAIELINEMIIITERR